MSKRIYLDQNKWIDIARAFYGRPDGKQFENILKKISEKVEAKEIILPLSALHFLETAKPEDKGRRERLAKFIFKLSNGFGLLPFYSLRKLEIINAIYKKLGEPKKIINLYDFAVDKKGLFYSFGSQLAIKSSNDLIKESLDEFINDEETIIRLMGEFLNRDLFKEMKKEDIEMLEFFEKERAKIAGKYDKETVKKIVLWDIIQNSLLPMFPDIFNGLGINMKIFTDNYLSEEKSIMSFFYDIPTVNVFVNLQVARDLEIQKRVDKNDVYDIGYLSTALPYCDIIVTENFWCAKIKEYGLDKVYGKQVLTDINDLLDII